MSAPPVVSASALPPASAAGPAHAPTAVLDAATKEETQAAFEDIYKNATWGKNGADAGNSGTGSTLDATGPYRAFLVQFLKSNDIHSVVDAGCGDWEFSSTVDWTGIDYKGFDIARPVIEADKKRFGKKNIQFFNEDIVEYKHVLLMNGVHHRTFAGENTDIGPGAYRTLDITAPPFNVDGLKVLTYFDGYHMHQLVHVERDPKARSPKLAR